MMIALLVALSDMSGWLWAVVAGVVAGGAGFWLGRRRGSPSSRLPAIREALGKSEEEGLIDTEEVWESVLSDIERHRETARNAQRLQLITQEIQEERCLLNDVLGALQDGVLVLERGERVLCANPVSRAVLGLGEQENPSLDQSPASFEIVDAIRTVAGADLARAVKSERVELELDSRPHAFVVRSLALDEDSLTKLQGYQIVLLEDVSSEEQAARAKTEFIYGVSHELKTPLTSIQASLEMLADGDGLEEEDRENLIKLSLGETQRLTRMVMELLDLARVEAGITEFKNDKVVMAELLDELRSLHQIVAERDSIDLRWDVSDYLPMVMGDPRLLRQAFVNLVGNAVKYTKSGGEVSLLARLEGSEVVVRIRDTGIGISEEDLPRVFDKFFRAGSAVKSTVQGTGLGLSMSRYILERHHGRIEMTSEIDVGTEFVVFLPAASSDPDASVESSYMAVDGM